MIPFLFLKTFNIVNDKQTTDEQHEYFLIMMEMFHQQITCRMDCTTHEVYFSFQISRKVLIDLSASTIHAKRKCLFVLTLQTIHWFFLQVQTGHDGGKTLRQYRQLRRLGPTRWQMPGWWGLYMGTLGIGQVHDDDIWLQLPEFISVLLCYLNLSIPLRIKE